MKYKPYRSNSRFPFRLTLNKYIISSNPKGGRRYRTLWTNQIVRLGEPGAAWSIQTASFTSIVLYGIPCCRNLCPGIRTNARESCGIEFKTVERWTVEFYLVEVAILKYIQQPTHLRIHVIMGNNPSITKPGGSRRSSKPTSAKPAASAQPTASSPAAATQAPDFPARHQQRRNRNAPVSLQVYESPMNDMIRIYFICRSLS